MRENKKKNGNAKKKMEIRVRIRKLTEMKFETEKNNLIKEITQCL